MAKDKKPVHQIVMTEGKRNIIKGLLSEYDINSADDIQDALKDLLGGTIKEMMESQMEIVLLFQPAISIFTPDLNSTDTQSS